MKVWARLVPSGTAREKLSLASSSFWQPQTFLVDGPLPPMTLHVIFPLCVSVSVSKFPLLISMPVILDLRPL